MMAPWNARNAHSNAKNAILYLIIALNALQIEVLFQNVLFALLGNLMMNKTLHAPNVRINALLVKKIPLIVFPATG